MFKVLPQPLNHKGDERRVGFELEFSGLTLQQTLEVCRDELDGDVVSTSPAQCVMDVRGLGRFGIEIDWDYLKRKAQAEGASESGWVKELGSLAENLVPIEIVAPPLTLKHCRCLLPLITRLRDAGAKGTGESLIAAYGVHINTEVPSLQPDSLLRYLQAFSLLQWWLVDAHRVDATRKLSPYIDTYPEAYTRLLASQDSVSLDQLIDDYLTHNPSRNRALDMLPIWTYLDESKVMSVLKDRKINARPAFHYRLPNCHLERSDWQLTDPWKIWWVVEALANDLPALAYWKKAFIDAEKPLVGVLEKDWKERLEQWLTSREWQ